MNALMKKLEELLEWGGIKKDVTLLVISGLAVLASLLKWQPLSFDMAWIAIILCGVPIVLEAIIGLVTAFDKTGTLTYGTPEVVSIVSVRPEVPRQELYRLAACAEQLSEHPLGKAIVRGARKAGLPLMAADSFRMLPGRGISAQVDGHSLLAGNPALLGEQGIPLAAEGAEELARGCTVTYLAVDGVYAGYIALSDTLRQESVHMIAALSALGVQPVLLTGDHENAARAIADKLHISALRANCLPEDKLTAIDEYQSAGQRVCMIGDGVNDAPALKRAEVGIAMGGVGSDIAVDAADIALVDDEVKELPHLIALSHRMMTTIRLNMTFSMLLNFVAIVLAIIGTLDPVVGALVHNAGSVLVITNSAFLVNWKKK
mgnify:CR=1 FL=1